MNQKMVSLRTAISYIKYEWGDIHSLWRIHDSESKCDILTYLCKKKLGLRKDKINKVYQD